MSFEETLRDRLEHDASTISLPDREPGRAVTRARARHRHRMTFAGVAAATAVAAAAIPLLTRSDRPAHDDKVAIPRAEGREPTGPLDLSWRATAGGLRTPLVANAGSDGSIYALGSAAATDTHVTPGNIFGAPTLYKLAADGTWESTALGRDDRPSAKDVVSANGKLYALSTGPADAARMSVSDDGGKTWTAKNLPPGEAPAGSSHLSRTAVATVASNGKDVLAVVSTSFQVDKPSALFPEMKTKAGLLAVQREEGISLAEANHPATGFAPVAPNGKRVTSSFDDIVTFLPGEPVRQRFHFIKTLPWSTVGVHSLADLGPTQQVFKLDGDTWKPLTTDPPLHLNSAEVHVAGHRFVIKGFQGFPARTLFYVSDDGQHWQQVTAANGDFLVGAGPALVSIPYAGTTVRVSQDGGASWKNVVLPVRPGEKLISASGGELGVAILYNAGPDQAYDLAVSGDLASWTVKPLESIVGAGPVYEAWTAVGNDKIVVSAVKADGPKPGGPAITAVGTPVR